MRVTGGGLSGVDESYLYDESGQRLRKIDHLAGVSTFYPFDGYEQTGAGASVRHYRFGGRTVAVRGSGSLAFLYGDQVGSTVYATDAGAATVASRGYFPFGAFRRNDGAMPTDQRFTGQREDGTGLYYMNARYYDPLIGHFISPDTLVPDPTQLSDYNRYLYARGNPLKYNDPSGYCATLESGKPDLKNDSQCWGLAQSIAGFGRNLPDTFAAQWHITPEQWLTDVAAQPYIDSNYLQPFAEQYEQEWERQVGLAVDPVKWHEPVNPPVKLLGQDAAQAVIEDIVACQNNMPIGCGNLLDDASLAVAGGAVLVCAAASGGTCLLWGGGISTGISAGSSGLTTYNALTGDATATDAIVSWSTTIVGAKFGQGGKGLAGVGIGAVQRRYDWWVDQQ